MTERATLPRPAREAAQHISALRNITPEQFERYGKELPQVLRRRAGYVIAEDARVLQAVKLLETGNWDKDVQFVRSTCNETFSLYRF